MRGRPGQAPERRVVDFEARIDPAGKIRVGVWDRICVPTGKPDVKDDMETEFSVENLTQMVANFAERGDPIPLDWNHQTNYASQNGQPAPAMAFYGAFAVVAGGEVVAFETGRDVAPNPGSSYVAPSSASPDGVDKSRDGLFGYRFEVTEIGERLLPGFKLVSPTFTPCGTRRDGSECGYTLMAVAATNSPFQEATEITFSKEVQMADTGAPSAFATPAGDSPDSGKERPPMKLSAEMLAKLGLGEDAAPEECYAALAKHLEAADAEKADMAAKLAKLEGDKKDAEMAKLEADDKKDDDKDDAKMAAMQATLAAMSAKLGKYEAREAAREKAEQEKQERKYEALADQAIAGGYPQEKRAALVKFARTDFDGARAVVEPFLPKNGAPAQLFERLTENGAPAGQGRTSREDALPVKPRRTVSMGRTFQEDDAAFADKIREVAFSNDPTIVAKLDKIIPDSQRAQKHKRLQAAERVVRAEYPALAAAADAE